MTTTTDTTDTTVDHDDADEHDHPSDGTYVKIAAILTVLTAIEVSSYFLESGAIQLSRDFLVSVILVLMVVKFAIVAMYFMHLKFDDPLLSRIFIAGILIALAVFVVMLSTLNFWVDSGVPEDYPANLRLVDPNIVVEAG
jgi:cytochrome c oxidase subunit 4